MNPFTKVVDEIVFTIPAEILKEAFIKPDQNWRLPPISIGEAILNKVIRPRVLVDMDLVGGQTVMVPLNTLQPEFVDNYSVVYRIPKSMTQNRSITSVLSVGYMPYANAYNSSGVGYGNVTPGSMGEVVNAGQRVMDSFSGVPPVSNANANIIAENTVLIRDQFRVTSAYILRCLVGNEENLNNISPRSYLALSELCQFAVKSFIYNTLIIKIDKAFLEGGQELGSFKTYIDSLADSETNYKTYLKENWQAVAFVNDHYAYNRLIKNMVSPGV